jgi:hypothetical protein
VTNKNLFLAISEVIGLPARVINIFVAESMHAYIWYPADMLDSCCVE